jgi:hypothetical protein
MPLEENTKPGSPGFKHNIETEISAGKSQKQAVAIAYGKARGDMLEEQETIEDNARNTGRFALAMGLNDACEALERRLDSIEGKKLHAKHSLQVGQPVSGHLHFK